MKVLKKISKYFLINFFKFRWKKNIETFIELVNRGIQGE